MGGHKVECKVRVAEVHESVVSSLMQKDRTASGKRHLSYKDSRNLIANVQETLEEQIKTKVADQGQTNKSIHSFNRQIQLQLLKRKNYTLFMIKSSMNVAKLL